MSHGFTGTDYGMFVRTPAWHHLGVVLDRYPGSWAEARAAAKLTWEPVEAPVYEFVGVGAEGQVVRDVAQSGIALDTTMFSPIEGFKRVIRSDIGTTLGVVGDGYQVIGHDEIGEVLELLMGQDAALRYECLFSIQGGRQVAAVLWLDEPITIPGDSSVTLPYLALTTRHDGTGALRVQSTTVRVVCANTISAAEAESDRRGTAFTFTHRGDWRERIDDAKQAIRGIRTATASYVQMATELAGIPVTATMIAQFVTAMIPSPPEGLISDRVRTNIADARGRLEKIIWSSPTCESVRGNAYGLLQAGTEYLDHYRRSRNLDSHAARQLLRAEPLKTKTVQIIKELVNA